MAAPAPALELLLAPAGTLPETSRRALVSEVESIWRDGRFTLRWLSASDRGEGGMSLRVLVTPATVASAAEVNSWGVGKLFRFDDARAIAVASMAGAERIVDEGTGKETGTVPGMREHRLGIVLGRAIAHEIGHYVLQTNTHASSGLMRATIDAREFADVRSGAFQLDRAARAHLAAAARIARMPPPPFSYPLVRYPSRRGPD